MSTSAGKFSLRNWAAAAEIISAIAVVVSLLYVGAGVRQNTVAIEGTTYQQVVRASNEYLLTVAADPTFAEILVRAWSDPSQLTAVEKVRFYYHERVFWRNMENAYFQNAKGVLGEQEWEVYSRIACKGKNEVTWERHAASLSTEFVEFIEACPE
jgi:hypothetical protein